MSSYWTNFRWTGDRTQNGFKDFGVRHWTLPTALHRPSTWRQFVENEGTATLVAPVNVARNGQKVARHWRRRWQRRFGHRQEAVAADGQTLSTLDDVVSNDVVVRNVATNVNRVVVPGTNAAKPFCFCCSCKILISWIWPDLIKLSKRQMSTRA